jgi:undecaprenyl pyrophosphate phosphatase UppP
VGLAIFMWGAFTVPLDMAKLVPGITVGGQALGASMSFPRVMSFWFNIPGTIFLLGGAVLSIWRFSKKKEYAYRMWANVLIAAGTLIIAAVGARARVGISVGLYPAEMVASALMLAGFLMAGTLDKGVRAVKARRRSAEDLAPDATT